jgi:hypothetical protein
MAQGWPLVVIAQRAEVEPKRLAPAYMLPTASVRTVMAVQRVFSDLRYKPGPSEQTRLKARRLGYLPWACWEGRMDDPAARPDLEGQDRTRVAAWRARQPTQSLAA